MNRRKFLQNTGITLGVLGVAGVVGSKIISSKISVDTDSSLLVKNSKKWANWSGYQTCTPKEFFMPTSEADIIKKLKTTTDKMRMVGGGHSFSPVVPTSDILTSLKNIKGILSHDPHTTIATINAGSHIYI